MATTGEPTREGRARSHGTNGLEQLGKARDGVLIIGGALYVLGYFVWSVHALNEGLGLLPALELQYLLAGSLLALVFLSALTLGLAAFAILNMGTRWGSSKHVAVRGFAKVIPLLFGGAAGIVTAFLWGVAGHFHFGFILVIVSVIVVAAVGTIPAVDSDRLWGAWTAAMIAIGGAVLYVGVVYPRMPQEIGGVKPRCGYLDIATGDASPSAIKQLFGSQTTATVARSRKLSIFFSGGDVYVVRVRGATDTHTYDVRKDIVKSVSYC
jgi:hypothetical protein